MPTQWTRIELRDRPFAGWFVVWSPTLALTSIILFLLPLQGCDPGAVTPESPTDSVLVELVADLYLEEARYQVGDGAAAPPLEIDAVDGLPSAGGSLQVARRDSVLGSHGYTVESYGDAMASYVHNPDLLQGFYDRVLNRLSERRQLLRDQ